MKNTRLTTKQPYQRHRKAVAALQAPSKDGSRESLARVPCIGFFDLLGLIPVSLLTMEHRIWNRIASSGESRPKKAV